jgi:hypothetical protein
VRRELASPIDFGQQRHRESIGMALITALRRHESPQTESAAQVQGLVLTDIIPIAGL